MFTDCAMTRIRIAALGSSFAASSGAGSIEDMKTLRSTINYPKLLAAKLDADLTDLSCAGATLLNVLDQPQRSFGSVFATIPPQLDSLPPDSDIVTLTAGGNDVGYMRGMFSGSTASYLGPLKSYLKSYLKHDDSSNALDLPALIYRFEAVIDRIQEIAPKAKIYLVEYVNVFGPNTKPGVDAPLDRDEIEYSIRLANLLSEANSYAAKARRGVEIIRMSELSQGHELGSEIPWVYGFGLLLALRGYAPYHPNLAAHEAIAEELSKRIQSMDHH
ncbi:hypothetical protein MMC10_010830 [Thelotrema lepadinum]|nr:hypothetical protein [Thelotrema lepadinum]